MYINGIYHEYTYIYIYNIILYIYIHYYIYRHIHIHTYTYIRIIIYIYIGKKLELYIGTSKWNMIFSEIQIDTDATHFSPRECLWLLDPCLENDADIMRSWMIWGASRPWRSSMNQIGTWQPCPGAAAVAYKLAFGAEQLALHGTGVLFAGPKLDGSVV